MSDLGLGPGLGAVVRGSGSGLGVDGLLCCWLLGVGGLLFVVNVVAYVSGFCWSYAIQKNI